MNNRPIKFRVWNGLKNKIIYPGDDIKDPNNIYDIRLDGTIRKFTSIAPLPDSFILMQFTGLQDKNNRDIYEGDILFSKRSSNVVDKKMGNYIVEYETEISQYIMRRVNGEKYDYHTLRNEKTWGSIIGNIYQNPELLK